MGGHVEPGSEDRRLALNVDVTATIAEAAGVAPAGEIEGVSLLGYAEREGFVLESPVTDGRDGSGQKVARPGYCGYRTRRFLYVRYSGGIEELYDYRGPVRAHERRRDPARRPADLDASPNRRTVPAASPGYVW